jgi:DNA-binding Lrp family transcriptional regulator
MKKEILLMSNNCISLLRDIKNKYSGKKVSTFHVFVHLLLSADENGRVITSRKSLMNEINLSERSIRTCLDKLEGAKYVTIITTKINSTISIDNYTNYNMNMSKRKSIKKPKEKSPTSEINTYKYFENNELNLSFIDWIDMRIKINKPPTERAIKMAVNKLLKMADNDTDRKIIVDYSTFKNYDDFYKTALNQGNNGFKQKFTSKNPATSDTELASNIAEGIDRGIRDKHI